MLEVVVTLVQIAMFLLWVWLITMGYAAIVISIVVTMHVCSLIWQLNRKQSK